MKTLILMLIVATSPVAFADSAADLAQARANAQIEAKVKEVIALYPDVYSDLEKRGDLWAYWACWYSHTDPLLKYLRPICGSLKPNDAWMIADEFPND